MVDRIPLVSLKAKGLKDLRKKGLKEIVYIVYIDVQILRIWKIRI